MNIHEFQGKSLLRAYNVDIDEGFIAETPEQAMLVAKQLQKKFGTEYFVIKAQIHAGGRGKGGGVKLANSVKEAGKITSELLGKALITPQTGPAGKIVRKVLVAQNIYYKGKSDIREFYISILLDRDKSRYVLMYSPDGGMSIEEVAEKTPERIFTEEINPAFGLSHFSAGILHSDWVWQILHLRICRSSCPGYMKLLQVAMPSFLRSIP